MKCGKLTAKLRDAVPVRFYENEKEIKRYKNIEIPDTIKELEFRDFRFDVPESGAITFKIFFAPGTLPKTWPEARQRKTRTKGGESIQEAADGTKITAEATDAANESHEEIIPAEDELGEESTLESMEIHFDVPGSARKALASAIGERIGQYPSYKAAPSFAYIIGDYTLDRGGKLTGPRNPYLLGCLTEDGYQTK